MPIKVSCPKCTGVLHAPDDSGGKRGRCPTCGTVLNIPADAPRAPSSVSVPAVTTDDHPFRSPANAATAAPPRPATFGLMETTERPAPSIPPPSFSAPEPRRVPTPSVTRHTLNLPGPDDEPTDVAGRGWQRVRRGLGWMRFGVVLLVLAVVAPAAVLIVNDKSPGTLPNETPGFLKVEYVSSREEIVVAAGVVPAVFGVLTVLLGRAGVARAPRSSFARGLARLSALGTVIAVGGLVAAAAPAVLLMTEGVRPPGLSPKEDYEGMVQRFGLAAAVGFGLAAEAWFVAAIGKIGAALHQRRAAVRSGRLMALAGLAFAATAIGYVGWTNYPSRVNDWWEANVQPQWDKLGADQLAVSAGAAAVLAVIFGMIYLRLIGAARHAVREWLAQNHVG